MIAALAILAAALAYVGPGAGEAEAAPPPRESPLYGPPYRHGLAVEVGVGLALCQPALLYAGVCGARGGSAPVPGVALRLGGGWRFNQSWHLSGAWIRQGHRPGGAFTGGASDGGMLALRGIVPFAPGQRGAASHVELGFELGLGWAQRVLLRDTAPNRLSSSGAVVRPALILDGWVLADLAIGIELATQLNFHWQHCVDDVCKLAPGPWVASELDRRWVDGFSIAVRATGLVFPRF
ncbi:hypothetical protein [Enhygromyxa salina]|uniref:hypothetical protein n=1 Tax=Enhygromyxa salina TaxID=215803 RepID=UPI000D091D22|nr:hypothetical protein [Enhygromyxa salina]